MVSYVHVQRATRSALLGFVLISAYSLSAQTSDQQTTPQPIEDYIHQSWEKLSRSMAECKSLVDPKVTTRPILYLPAAMPVPPAVEAMQRQCSVEVQHLPRVIHALGDILPTEIPREGLLYLPERYVVPGGRFNEMYGWDSYFILLGLVQDGHVPLAKGMVENFFFEIENYGSVLNANRTYFLTRSQPPFLSSMIDEIYRRTADKVWLARAYHDAEQDYALWTRAPHLAGDTGLARYSDLGSGPVPEMADDSTYYPDVIRWLLAHPGAGAQYLVRGAESPSAAEARTLAMTSCDVTSSRTCLHAWAEGHRLTATFYHGDRAMRESGFDTSFRFGPFSGSTDEFAPVDLNSLLYKYAMDMAKFASELGLPDQTAEWTRRARTRKAAIDHYLWHPETGLYEDFDFVSGKASTYPFVSTFYPLWAGVATPAQASAVHSHLDLFACAGGVQTSTYVSGVQWDAPFGWAPTNYITIVGLAQSGFGRDAQRLARAFRQTVQRNYLRDGTIREKYNVVNESANIELAAGYKTNVIGFGWTNAVYSRLGTLLNASQTYSSAVLLAPEELQKLVPATVFFQGQTSTTQLRNSAGLRFANSHLLLAAKVDTGGYATAVAERYQIYLLTEAPLLFAGHTLAPGAYGAGFVNGKWLVMDLGGNQLFSVAAPTDPTLKRPVPLKIEIDGDGMYRLLSSRSYVRFGPATAVPQN